MKRYAAFAPYGILLALCLTSARAGEPATLVPPNLDALAARSIGPTNMSGRVTAIAVVEKRPATQYVASASGGLWKTVNNGITWKPVFDQEKTVALGDVAVAASNPEVVWAGTGEANARNSVSSGDGVYKSMDGGKTWKNMGLRDSQHVGRIVIHPKDPDVVYVAALGHLWGSNKKRGLFKTTDGGQTWETIKYINDETGFIDLAMDPTDCETQDDRRRQNVGEAHQRNARPAHWPLRGQYLPHGPAHPLRRRADRPDDDPHRPRPAGKEQRSTGQRRHLPLGRQGRDVEQGERPLPPAVLLRAGPRRSER